MTETTLIALLLAGGLFSASPAHADVNVGINVAPPPVLAVASPPHLVAVPGSPVFYGPNANYNLFVYGGRYYSFRSGTWFFAASPGGSWSIIVCAPARARRAADVLQDPARPGQEDGRAVIRAARPGQEDL